MNNWHLLLALVAVFQPIACFTDHSLVDGREQCCDRQSRSLLRETRSPFHGPHRYTKTTPEERRLNHRDEIREDRRSELRFFDSSHRGTAKETYFLRNLERDTREPATRSRFRATTQRFSIDENRDRLLEGTRQIRNIKPVEQSRRVTYDSFKRNVRYSRSSRDVTSAERNDEERSTKLSDFLQSRGETRPLQIRSQELRGDSPNQQARGIPTIRGTRQTVARNQSPRENVLRREPSEQREARRENTERRTSERRSKAVYSDRRLSSPAARTVVVRDLHLRLNSRDAIGESRFNTDRQNIALRFEEKRLKRDDNKVFRDRTNSVQRLSVDRAQLNERNIHKSTLSSRISDRNQGNERLSREVRDDYQKEVINDVRRFREGRDGRTNKVQREIRNTASRSTENIRIDNHHRNIRSKVRHSGVNPTERASELRREIRNDERRSTENRRDIRDDVRRVRVVENDRTSELRRDNERRVNNREPENERATRITERRFNQNREKINDDLRKSRRDLRRFRDETSELRRDNRNTASRSFHNRERSNEDQRYVRNDIRNNRIKEIRNNERQSRDVRDDRFSRKQMESFDLKRFREVQNKRMNENRMTIRNNARTFRETRYERARDSRREIREGETRWRESQEDRRSIDTRHTEFRKLIAFERDNVILDGKARSLEFGTFRDSNAGFRLTRSADISTVKDSRIRVKSQSRMDNSMERAAVDSHARLDSARNRDNLVVVQNEMEEDDKAVLNWQYVFYTLQGIYLCGFLVQMLAPNDPIKSKSGCWWPVRSQSLIKVD